MYYSEVTILSESECPYEPVLLTSDQIAKYENYSLPGAQVCQQISLSDSTYCIRNDFDLDEPYEPCPVQAMCASCVAALWSTGLILNLNCSTRDLCLLGSHRNVYHNFAVSLYTITHEGETHYLQVDWDFINYVRIHECDEHGDAARSRGYYTRYGVQSRQAVAENRYGQSISFGVEWNGSCLFAPRTITTSFQSLADDIASIAEAPKQGTGMSGGDKKVSEFWRRWQHDCDPGKSFPLLICNGEVSYSFLKEKQ